MAATLRNRPADIGRQRSRELVQRFGADLRAARVSAGMTQRALARLAGVSQGVVSRIERGLKAPSIDLAARVGAAVGGDLGLRLYPGPGIGLRDSGQLRIAELIRGHVAPHARVTLEMPVGEGADRRAADMVVEAAGGVCMLEVERTISDFQAQYRAAQLKRHSLAERLGRSVRLVIAVNDTHRNRRVVGEHAGVVRAALPVSSRQIWMALGIGQPLTGDGLLWLRDRDRRTDERGASSRTRTRAR